MIELALLRISHINEFLETQEEYINELIVFDDLSPRISPENLLKQELIESAEMNLTLPEVVIRLTFVILDKESKQSLGFIILNNEDESDEFQILIWVAPNQRRQGHGLKTLKLLPAALSGIILKRLIVEININDIAQEQLFKKAGYKLINEFDSTLLYSNK